MRQEGYEIEMMMKIIEAYLMYGLILDSKSLEISLDGGVA